MGFFSWVANTARAFAVSFLALGPVQAETFLIMFEEQGCPYCELWKEEIGPIYPKTSESEIAPLLIIELGDPLPEGITIDAEPVFTPTFVLVNNGVEVDRLVGYPGEDFFWGLLDRMLSKLPEQNTEGSS